MKTILKIVMYVVCSVFLAAGAGVAYLFLAFPKSEAAPQIAVEVTPERLARGKYLANNVVGCLVCHSVRNMKLYAGPMVAGTEGQGHLFLKEAGLGSLTAPNITPNALREWSDGEILRAITSGVNRKGKALFPIMPYQEFALLSREDLYSIIVYIRTLPPKSSELPPTRLEFPLNLIVRTIPAPTSIREQSSAVRGEYLTTIASCRNCHTPKDERRKNLPGMDFAGGMEFRFPEGSIRSVNLTPDSETGIGTWSREGFITTFKRFESPDLQQIPVSGVNTVMPWTNFAGMTKEDLGAIYDYLRTVPPIRNKIVNLANPAKAH